MKILLKIFVSTHIITFVLSTNATKNNQEYFLNYNDDENNDTIDVKSLVFPTSEDGTVDYEGHQPDIELPDDSLADSDLRDHNLIDSITYVYNVKSSRNVNELTTILTVVEFTLNGIVLVYGLANTLSQLRKYPQVGLAVHLQLIATMLLYNVLLLVNISRNKSQTICTLVAFGINYSQSIIIFWISIYIWYTIRDTGIRHGLLPILYCHPFIFTMMFVFSLKLQLITFGEFCFLHGGFATAILSAILFAVFLWITPFKYNTIFIPRICNLDGCKKSCLDLDAVRYRKLTGYMTSKKYEMIREEELPNPTIYDKYYNLIHTFILIIYIGTFGILYIRPYEVPGCVASVITTTFICIFYKAIPHTIHGIQEGDNIDNYPKEIENNLETPDAPEIINELIIIN